VLVVRGQDLTDEQQLAFTLNFGVLERYRTPGHVLFAGSDQLHRPHARGDRRAPAGAQALGAHAPGHRPQVALPVRARRRHRRLDRARGQEVRDVRRTTLAGDAPTVEQEPVE